MQRLNRLRPGHLRTLTAILATVTPLASAPAPAAGQAASRTADAVPPPPARFVVTATLGGAAWSDFRRVAPDPPAAMRRITAETSFAAAAALTWWPHRHWGVRGSMAYAPTRVEVIEGRSRTDDGVASEPWARLHVYAVDVAVIARPDFRAGDVLPYVAVGAGVVEYRVMGGEDGRLPPEMASGFAGGRRRHAAGVIAAGAEVPMRQFGVRLVFEGANHIVRRPTPGEPATDFDPDPLWTSNLRLLVGLSLPIGTPRPQRP
jgi:hypothetical protein